MAKLSFDLYLDESGNFESDPNQWATVSMVGGLLIPSHRLPNRLLCELVKERIHAKEAYDHKVYFDILRRLIKEQGKFIVFNNDERISVINGDFTYLNIISEGIVQLIRNLKIQFAEDEIVLHILIAGRQAISYKRDAGYPDSYKERIQQDEYFARIEEKLIIAIGRSKIQGITWDISFGTGDVDKRLMLADLICFTWRFRKGKEFTEQEKTEIEELIDPAYIYSVFENATVGSLKRLLIEERYEEILYQLCNLRKLAASQQVCQELLNRMKEMSVKELEALLNYMSLQIARLNDAYSFADGIALAQNFEERILLPLENVPRRLHDSVVFSRFDTDFYLLTMYDHIGNVKKCEEYLAACKQNIAAVRRSTWEHIDYYFRFRIRELNVLMGRFAFDEILERSHDLAEILTEARDLFSMIRTYDGEEQTLRSELLGKVYGVRIEAMINLLHLRPELLEEAIHTSDQALVEFVRPSDISRQMQWRCLLMVEAGQADEALGWLLRAVKAEDPPTNQFDSCVRTIYHDLYDGRDYLLWHYTNVMLLLKQEKDQRGEEMRMALNKEHLFKEDIEDIKKAGHPWNLVLWNLAKYSRLEQDSAAFNQFYNRSMAITRENKANVTMLTFAMSMSADRLLWCQRNGTKDTTSAQAEYLTIVKDITKAGITEEMRNAFLIDQTSESSKVTSSILKSIAESYLK